MLEAASRKLEKFAEAIKEEQDGFDADAAYQVICREAAIQFLDACSLEPIPDAVDQLVESFLPALRIMVERGYHPNGETWRRGGWRGLLLEIDKKRDRLWHRSWLHSNYDADSSLDLMNFAGMYYRLKNAGLPWGTRGEPGSGKVSQVSMGDYSSVTR